MSISATGSQQPWPFPDVFRIRLPSTGVVSTAVGDAPMREFVDEETRADGCWLTDRLRADPVLVILSPPRCGSTAVARSFWQHPLFRWYIHEPYDRVYHHGGDRDSIQQA